MRKTVDFKTACAVKGISENLPDVSGLPEEHQKFVVDMYKAAIIVDGINEENNNWKPDYANSKQYKYQPYFEFVPGVGFVFDSYVCWYTASHVGSRLVLGNSKDAEYAAEIFIKEGLTI